MSTKIQKVLNQPNFPELEDSINKFWKENYIFQKSVEQRDLNNSYSFVDGPPFPSGMPHYGHLLQSIGKDIIPRYWTMKGKKVRRVWGWDCHGLPVEAKVNKKLGIVNRKQVEEDFGVAEYVKECRKYVESCIADWKWYIDKVGRWVDLDNPYYTMKPEFNESVLWAFKQIWNKGYIYKGKRVSLYSTDTYTPVGDFEVAEANDWRDIEDLSIFAKFELEESSVTKILKGTEIDNTKKIYMVAWTTTPWTIPSNFALCVNENIEYVLVEFEGEYFILSKERLAYCFHTNETNIGSEKDKLVRIIKEFKGSVLEKLDYKPIYNYFTDKKTSNDFKIYLSENVLENEGTGVLHVAPAFGEVDYNIGKDNGLSDKSDIDEEGKMSVEPWKGIYLRDASPLIAEDLEKNQKLLRTEKYTHRLPFFRGDNPLIYMAQDSYFVDIQKIKNQMLDLNDKVNWYPSSVKNGRVKAILESAPDWCISRNRYWATVMPLWKSEDGDEIVIGSFEELAQLSKQVIKKEENGIQKYYLITDLEKYNEEQDERYLKPMSAHRDICDQIILEKNGKQYKRVSEILDVWLDSASAPFAQFHYPFENKELFENNSPADFVMEGLGQVRAWFNVMLRISTILFSDIAYKNVICTGNLSGNDGRKMSKTYGNYPDPKDVLENVGGEATRLYLMGSGVVGGGDSDWSDEILADQTKNILLPIWNTYKYLSIYAELHNWSPIDNSFSSNNILDKWLESYINKVTVDYSQALENYDIPTSVKLIQPAIENISSWWIRRSRSRFVSGDKEALQTLYAVLVQFIKTFAPQMPFITEEIYQNLVRNTDLKDNKESIHLEDFPKVDLSSINIKLLEDMEIVRKICNLGLKVRDDKRLKLRQPLSKAQIVSSSKSLKENKELLVIIKDELNVKTVEIVEKLETEGLITNVDSDLTVALDTKLTEDLVAEGLLNELSRGIQNLRKTSGLKMGELVKVVVETSNEDIKNIIGKFGDELCKNISASSVEIGKGEESTLVKIEGENICVSFIKG